MPRTVYRMEMVERLGEVREPGWLYFLRGCDVWRSRIGVGGSAEPVATGSFTREPGYTYSVTAIGDVIRIRRRLADAMLGGWPARGEFQALADGARVELRSGQRARLWTVELGALPVSSGALAIVDPVRGADWFSARIAVPNGNHRVVATAADLSTWRKRSFMTTHVSVLLSDAPETRRELWIDDAAPPDRALDVGDYPAVGVDSGMVIVVDAAHVPDASKGERWARLLAAGDEVPGNRAQGVAPGAGDGMYPVVLGYDAAGRLAYVHVDFLIAPPASAWEGQPFM